MRDFIDHGEFIEFRGCTGQVLRYKDREERTFFPVGRLISYFDSKRSCYIDWRGDETWFDEFGGETKNDKET